MINNLLICVGAQKSGTTWLHHQLEGHPDIFFPNVKEVHYFNTIHNGSFLLSQRKVQRLKKIINEKPFALEKYFTSLSMNQEVDRGIKDLLSKVDDRWYKRLLFSKKKYSADFTPEYALLPDQGFENIKAVSKNQKILFIMRDPVDRALSAIRYFIQMKGLDFNVIDDDFISRVSNYDFIESMSRYDNTIRVLRKNFDEDSLKFIFYENLMLNKTLELNKIYDFLGLAPCPNQSDRLNAKLNPSTDLKIPESVVQSLEKKLETVYEFIDSNFSDMPNSWRF
jgi:hypothetical protein